MVRVIRTEHETGGQRPMNIRDFDEIERQRQSEAKRQFGPTVLSRDGDHQAAVKAAKIIAPQGKPSSLLIIFTLDGGQEISKFFAINAATEKGQKYAHRMLSQLANSCGLIRTPDDPNILVGKRVTLKVRTGPWWKDEAQESTEVIGFSPVKAPPSPPSQATATGSDLDNMPF